MPWEQSSGSPANALEGLNLSLGGRGPSVPESLSDEIERLRNEFAKRSERAAMVSSEIVSGCSSCITPTSFDEQEWEVKRLWESVRRKEEEVEASWHKDASWQRAQNRGVLPGGAVASSGDGSAQLVAPEAELQ
ncbi:hypothetical protein MLD38_014108 [Melastoma candidum]|uniref:Uncharacterized protein n=1 Tax=Melastoma candidum TaxID=119954 RepID=A0ACB9RDL2_9MYRT|nr:hypothetical protein MLD38_014108 [Melastoma candidum]